VDQEEDADQREGGGEEGDEAADDDLGRAAGDAQGPVAGDEETRQLDAGDGEEEAGEDAAGAEPGEEDAERLPRVGGLERGEDVSRGGDEAGGGGVEGVAPGERVGGTERDPEGDAAAEGPVGEEEERLVWGEGALERGPGRLGEEEEEGADEDERERADDAVADGDEVPLLREPLRSAGKALASRERLGSGGREGQGSIVSRVRRPGKATPRGAKGLPKGWPRKVEARAPAGRRCLAPPIASDWAAVEQASYQTA